MAYCVRIRFCMAERLHIDSPEVEVAIPDPRNGKDVTLRSIEADTPIAEAKHLALIVKSYPSEDEALAAGEWWKGVLGKAFARVRIGVDFGERRGTQTMITDHGREWMREQFQVPPEQPVLDDVHGVMVFECEPWPKFVRGELTGVAKKSFDNFSGPSEPRSVWTP